MDGLVVGKIVNLATGGGNKNKKKEERYAEIPSSNRQTGTTSNSSDPSRQDYGRLGREVVGGTYGSMITPTTKEDEEGSIMDIINTIIKWIVAVAVSALATFLSWNCNTYQGTPMPLKIVYAVLSFVFGWVYLILYALFFRLECHPSKGQQSRVVGGRK